MKTILILAIIVAISAVPASFAESTTIQADGKSFDVQYSFDGELLAMDIDQESKSLLVGLDGTKESTFEITFPSELLSAENGDFVVLVDGLEEDYTITYDNNKQTLTLPIPEETQEIEIIGTSVVPEFPFGVLVVMGVVVSVAVVFSRSRLAIFK
ncbi:MAG: hypothetical protein EB150_04615 [Nitrososphaeria archaeon]|nr:hypothetical protein [Nitrososphaeria archaeon]NDB51411.1 hypothetical protein [Nitrosopumilaceae archaeon]NDB87412.1 hypothetical protein [Nitrososphaerota archaeon]NDB90024.1 hypothetical protein [Nitrososphaerota archaeon]NDB91920.1 hypothetical protein [Nitrososphaeria archaeon]